MREDGLVSELPNLVGPVLFELDVPTLKAHGHIAPVVCTEIHCPLTPIFADAYRRASTLEEKRLLYICNPNKIRMIGKLVLDHLHQRHKVMVFCDNLFGLHLYRELLKFDEIYGATHTSERHRILSRFREGERGDCVLFSQVGDQSIDLPEAHVVIQVALMHGSRMQEGQRIGRVQRPMAGKPTAYFYSLVCDTTEEVKYAEKRRSFLLDHGYNVHVVDGDEWRAYVDAKTAQLDGAETQKRILSQLGHELKRRKTLREQGVQDEPDEPDLDFQPGQRPVRPDLKRKDAPLSKIEQIRKRQRRDNAKQ